EAAVDDAEGTFVADGAIGVNRSMDWDARLGDRPVTLTLRDRTVGAITSPDPVLNHFLGRAVHTHRADRVATVRVGVHPVECGFSPINGPVNAMHPGLTLRLDVDPTRAYNTASADLWLDLTAVWSPEPWEGRR